ncbi:MAG: helix-turn-helix domain-containing protein [Gammaproteobacteria bacterium]|nr:helix-turn-helix domain-containing protein [Gammaproteobacteria bacterium]
MAPVNESSRLFTPAELAEQFGSVSASSIYRWIAAGTFPIRIVRVGPKKAIRIPEQAVRNWIHRMSRIQNLTREQVETSFLLEAKRRAKGRRKSGQRQPKKRSRGKRT